MTAFGRLARRAENIIRSEDFWGAWARGDDVPSSSTLAGVSVTRESAVQLSAVWACVRLLSDTISTLPVGTFRRENGARLPTERKSWLDAPNPEQTRVEFVEQQVGSLLLDGTAYVMVVRDRFGDPVELWNVHPDRVTPKREDGRVVYHLRDGASTLRLSSSDMFHIPAFAWPGELRGVSPLEHARRVIGLGLASHEFAERFYGQGMNQSGVIETQDDLTVEQARELKADFSRANGGLAKSHLPAVLVRAKWAPMTVTPEQAQFLESRKYSTAEIARWFRVPPHLIGDVDRSTSWGTGIEEQNIGFVTYGIRHWLERLELAWTKHLLLDPEEFVKFNVDGLLRGDQKSRFEAYGVARQWGWMSADDVRAKEDLAPLPEGQGSEYLVPLNMRGATDGSDGATPRELAEIVQKIYLGVGVVLSATEAREIVEAAGWSLSDDFTPTGGRNENPA